MKQRICVVCFHYEISHQKKLGCLKDVAQRFDGKNNPVQFCDCAQFLFDDGIYLRFFDESCGWAVGWTPDSYGMACGFNPHCEGMREQIYAAMMGWA